MNPKSNSSLTKVTPLSKALAAILFIAMPFVGLYIGYTYAPEKVVEVEKVVIATKDIPSTTSDLLENKAYHVNEVVSLGMGSFDTRDINFEIGAYRYKKDNFFSDHLVFEQSNATVLLVDYFSEYPSTQVVLQLAKKTDADLESQFEDLYFTYVLSANIPDRSNVEDWKERCTLSSKENLITLLDMNVPEDEFGRRCVFGSFQNLGDILVYNPGYPSDAHEPKVVRESVNIK